MGTYNFSSPETVVARVFSKGRFSGSTTSVEFGFSTF